MSPELLRRLAAFRRDQAAFTLLVGPNTWTYNFNLTALTRNSLKWMPELARWEREP